MNIRLLEPHRSQHTTLLALEQGILKRRRAAHQDLEPVDLLHADLLEHLGADVALLVALGDLLSAVRLGDGKDAAEPVRVVLLHLQELVLEEQVLGLVDAPDQRELGAVGRVGEQRPRKGVHGRDAGAAGDHGHLVVLLGVVPVHAHGNGHEAHRLAGLQGVQGAGALAVGVELDQVFDEALLSCLGCLQGLVTALVPSAIYLQFIGTVAEKKLTGSADRCVRPRSRDPAAVRKGKRQCGLGESQTAGGLTVGKLKAQALRVVVDHLGALQLERGHVCGRDGARPESFLA